MSRTRIYRAGDDYQPLNYSSATVTANGATVSAGATGAIKVIMPDATTYDPLDASAPFLTWPAVFPSGAPAVLGAAGPRYAAMMRLDEAVSPGLSTDVMAILCLQVGTAATGLAYGAGMHFATARELLAYTRTSGPTVGGSTTTSADMRRSIGQCGSSRRDLSRELWAVSEEADDTILTPFTSRLSNHQFSGTMYWALYFARPTTASGAVTIEVDPMVWIAKAGA